MAQREDREKASSARSTGSDKSAPSVAQRTPGQIRKHRKRSYAGRAARCLLCCVLCTLLTRSSVSGRDVAGASRLLLVARPGRNPPNAVTHAAARRSTQICLKTGKWYSRPCDGTPSVQNAGREHAGSVASGVAASEFTQDGASTFAPSHGTGEDDSSDWDRFSDDGNETTSSTALSDGSGPASQVPSWNVKCTPSYRD